MRHEESIRINMAAITHMRLSLVPTINVDGKVAFTPLAAERAEIPYSLSLTNILHPPRV
jgi:hypothetical protein